MYGSICAGKCLYGGRCPKMASKLSNFCKHHRCIIPKCNNGKYMIDKTVNQFECYEHSACCVDHKCQFSGEICLNEKEKDSNYCGDLHKCRLCNNIIHFYDRGYYSDKRIIYDKLCKDHVCHYSDSKHFVSTCPKERCNKHDVKFCIKHCNLCNEPKIDDKPKIDNGFLCNMS
jgi:hypothetical protein